MLLHALARPLRIPLDDLAEQGLVGHNGAVRDTAVVDGELPGDVQQLIEVLVDAGEHGVVGGPDQGLVEAVGELAQVLHRLLGAVVDLLGLPHVPEQLLDGGDILVGAPLGGVIGREGLQHDTQLQQIPDGVRRGVEGEIHLADQALRGGVLHIGAVAGAAVQHPHILQDLERLTDGDTADVELLGQLPLGGQLLARLKLSIGNHLADVVNHVLVEAAAAVRLLGWEIHRTPPFILKYFFLILS